MKEDNINSQNPIRGRKFQKRVMVIAEKRFGCEFVDEKAVAIGNPPKDHRFDLVSADGKIIIECKYYSWTQGNNVPSAKMATLNEAVLYMRCVSYDARKIIIMKKEINENRNETFAEYYCRINGHLLNDIEIWQVDDKDMIDIVK